MGYRWKTWVSAGEARDKKGQYIIPKIILSNEATERKCHFWKNLTRFKA